MTATIHERGYRRYNGPRLGPAHAMRSVYANTLRRILGLGRPARAKVLPIIAMGIAYLPALVFVGVVALLPNRLRDFVPSYAAYYGFVSAAIVLFAVFVAPEALCPDRRSRVLSLYLAAPLTRGTYLLSKAAAVASVMAVVTLGPPLFLLIGLVVESDGPHGTVGVLSILARILVSGAALSTVYTALALAAASMTDRRAFASAGGLLVLLGSGAIVNVLVFGLHAPALLHLLNMGRTPFELVQHIYGKPAFSNNVSLLDDALASAAYVLVGGGVAAWRYLRLQVTR